MIQVDIKSKYEITKNPTSTRITFPLTREIWSVDHDENLPFNFFQMQSISSIFICIVGADNNLSVMLAAARQQQQRLYSRAINKYRRPARYLRSPSGENFTLFCFICALLRKIFISLNSSSSSSSSSSRWSWSSPTKIIYSFKQFNYLHLSAIMIGQARLGQAGQSLYSLVPTTGAHNRSFPRWHWWPILLCSVWPGLAGLVGTVDRKRNVCLCQCSEDRKTFTQTTSWLRLNWSPRSFSLLPAAQSLSAVYTDRVRRQIDARVSVQLNNN